MKNWRKLLKKVLVLGLSITLVLGSVDLSTLTVRAAEETEEVIYTKENPGRIEGELLIEEMMTSAPSFGFFSLTTCTVDLKEGTYTRWIDRIDVPEDLLTFYATLEEAADDDGLNDYLIDDSYFTGDHGIVATTVKQAVTTDTIQETVDTIIEQYTPFVYAVVNAFDRDHPEVFWNSGTMALYPDAIYYTEDGITYVEVDMCYMLQYTNYDVRDTAYNTQAKIEAGIEERENRVTAIHDSVDGMSDYNKVKEFNKQLTMTNAYNSSDDLDAIDNSCRECISALKGSIGTAGPVCESYARAMKVLCDREGIPCVLVDGANHMWNYIQIDGKWYAVDVTWNDPLDTTQSIAVSGYENEKYLLVGSDTIISGVSFISEHPVENQLMASGVAFTNGPILETTAYVPKVTTDINAEGMSVSVADGGTYDGSAKKPVVTVKNGETTLVENTHYTLIYENNINAGTNTAKVTVEGIDDYSGSKVLNFSIAAADASTALTATGEEQNLPYGSVVFTEPTFKGCGEESVTGTIVYSKDAESDLTYEQAKAKVATASSGDTIILGYTFTPSNSNYTGTKTGSVTITVQEANLSSAIVTLTDVPSGGYVYDNTNKTPAVSVVLNGVTLEKDTDYTVNYTNNKNAGTDSAKVTITGTGNYAGTVEKVFSIAPSTDITVEVEVNQDIVYQECDFDVPTFKGVGGETVEGTLTFRVIGEQGEGLSYEQAKAILATLDKDLNVPIDYTFVPTNTNYTGTKSGSLAVTIRDVEFYVGNMPAEYQDVAYTLKETPTYGDTWAELVTIKENIEASRGDDKDTDLSHFRLNVSGTPNAGEHTFKILYSGTVGGRTYTDVEVSSGSITVARKDISSTAASISTPAEEIIYTKSALTPDVLVKDGDKTLVLDTDYTVSYSNNINVGSDTATVTVTGKGNYTGTKDVKFSIAKADASKVTMNVATSQDVLMGNGAFTEPVATGIDGEAIDGDVTYSYAGAVTYDDVKLKLADLEEGATATVIYTFTAAADSNYSATKTGTINLKVVDIEFKMGEVKATIDNTVKIADSAIFGMTWDELVTIKSGLSATRGNEIDATASHFTLNVTGTPNVGTQEFSVVYNGTVGDKVYENAIVCTGTVEVETKNLSVATMTLTIPNEGYTYSATEYKPEPVVKMGDITLIKDTDYTVSYADNINAGTNTATVTVTGKGNYTGTKSSQFSIAKKPVTATVVADKVYDGNKTANVTATVNATELCGLDTIVITGSTGTYASAAVGEDIAVHVTLGAITGDGSENYEVKLPTTVTGTISKKTVKVQATNLSKNYGQDDPTWEFTFLDGTALVSGDSFTGKLERTAGENAGTYTITQGTLANANYEIVFAAGTFTINAVDYTATVNTQQDALSNEVTFVQPVFKGVNEEVVSGTLTYSYDGENGLTYDGLVAKLNTLPGDSTATVTYQFVPTASGNYTGDKTGTLTIKIKDILFMVGSSYATIDNVVTMVANPTYGMTWSELITINAGLKAVRGDKTDSNASHFTLSVTGIPNAGDNQAFQILYSGTVGTQEYTNQEVCSGTIDVAKKKVIVSAGTYKVSKIYDTTVVAGTNSGELEVTGVLTGDTEVVVNSTFGNYSNPNVKGQEKISITLSLSGAKSENYQLATTTLDVPCEITPLAITPTITITGAYTYTGNDIKPSFTITAGSDELAETDYVVGYENNRTVGTATVKFTAAPNGNYKWDGTIEKTFEISKATYEGNKTLTVSGVYGTQKEVDIITLLEEDVAQGVVFGTLSENDADNILENVTLTGTKFSYELVNDSALIGKTATVTLPVLDSAYYVAYDLEITIKCTDKMQQNISFATSAVTKTVGDAPFVNALGGVSTGSTVTYTSSNGSVATVDSTGKVTILKAGQTEITATASSTDSVFSGMAKYTLTVKEKPVQTPSDVQSEPTQSTTTNNNTSQGNSTAVAQPKLSNADGKDGWSFIRKEALIAKAGESVIVDMNGTTSVPKDMMETISGKDVELVLEMSEGIQWTIHGSSVTSSGIKEMDFGVKTGANNIPSKLLTSTAGTNEYQMLSLAYDGEFGFKATLTLNMNSRNAGMYANLFYYNEELREMEFICASQINQDGDAKLLFEHASDYLVVVADEILDESAAENVTNDSDTTVDSELTDVITPSEDKTPDSVQTIVQPNGDEGSSIWIILVILVIAVVAICGIIYVVMKKKK